MRKGFLLNLLYKYLTIIIIIIVSKQFSTAQTVYRGNLYPYYKYTLNSAYAGADGYKSLFLDYRNTSTGIAGSPKQIMFGYSMPIMDKMGLGIRLENHTEGLFGFFTGLIDYSYYVKLSNEQSLRFGISAGLTNRSLDNSKVRASDPSAIAEITSNYFTGPSFESAAGVVYQWSGLSVELSAPRLYGTAKTFKPNFSSLITYNFNTLNNQVVLQPSVLLMYQSSAPLVYDINLTASIKENFMFGIGYRNRPGLVLSAGLLFDEIKILYAAELGIGNYSNIFNTIHEISLGYTFKRVKKHPVDSTYNPPLNLIVKTDSIKPDSLGLAKISQTDTTNYQDLDTTKVVIVDDTNEKQDTLNTDDTQIIENEQSPVLVEIADGIYAIKQEDRDSTLTESELDSLLNKFSFKKRNKKNRPTETEISKDTTKPEITEISNGIYSVDSEDLIDKKTGEISDKKVDKLIEQIVFDEIPKKEENNKDEKNIYNHEKYYTLLLKIDKNSELLNKNMQISEYIRAERSTDGKINYYYGKFSKESSAQQAANEISKKGYQVIEIIKISAHF